MSSKSAVAAPAAGAAPEKAAQKKSGGGLFSIGTFVRAFIVVLAATSAYQIRTYAIVNYGLVIHEFDPWFNFRATQYLADNGWDAFFSWFDHMSWYPLGRPVGTTIYPGMQVTSVFIWNKLNEFGIDMSLNDVCVYVPVWFGVCATMFLGLLAREVTNSNSVGAAAAAVFAIIPAHIMRSVGGGYDNESVAMTAMMMTFFFWTRSLRTKNSWWFGILAGLAYFYMVAVWGGYIFVLNMVAAHAAGLVLLGRHSSTLHLSYSLFYIIGTALAIQVPVVGLAPLKSLEQLGAAGVFCLVQLMEITEQIRRRKNVADEDVFRLRTRVFGAAALLAALAVAFVFPKGYFGPLSSRVRSLFVQHTRTGNPLVDSVAEHQPASPDAYWQYLHIMCYLAPIGFGMSFYRRTDAKYFGIFYAVIAYYFANRMARLIILIGPIASILGGIVLGRGVEWAADQLFNVDITPEKPEQPKAAETKGSKSTPKGKPGKAAGKRTKPKKRTVDDDDVMVRLGFGPMIELYNSEQGKYMRKVGAVALMLLFYLMWSRFSAYSQALAQNLSQPSIMFKARLRDGSEIMVDDYREAYWWLRDNTPEDSRVMAWWDYGYQIAGVANRTTIADGNTWNHEHIATLGRALTSPEKRAHRIVRHLADYVLIWTGGGGDDLAKSPHMARIGNSVYEDICPGDPTCRRFGFNQDGTPTKMMSESLLYRLHSHNQVDGVSVDENRFQEVYTSKYNKVRIYKVMSVSKESKEWAADPSNWNCDHEGSWYCPGDYPPALSKVLSKGRAFKQLEDFNVEVDEKDLKYREEYMKKMAGH